MLSKKQKTAGKRFGLMVKTREVVTWPKFSQFWTDWAISKIRTGQTGTYFGPMIIHSENYIRNLAILVRIRRSITSPDVVI